MTRSEYLIQLRQRLSGLSEAEIADAVAYCNEYFDEAGEGNEQQAINDLGTPAKFAAQLRADAVLKSQASESSRENGEAEKSNKRSLKNLWMMILGICALPIALPLGLALILLLFSMMLVVFCVIFALFIAIVGFLAAGGVSFASGIYYFSQSPGNSLIALGLGCASIGLSLLVILLTIYLSRKGIPGLTRMVSHLYQRFRRKETGE